MSNKMVFAVAAVMALLFSMASNSFAAAVQGNSTSTFIAVWSGAGTIAGFSNFTYDNSTALFAVNGKSSLQGLTFTNATGTSLSVTSLAFTNASGTNFSASGYITAGTPIAVSSGGTATSSFTYGVTVASGTQGFSTIAPGASGNVLTSNGTTWVSQARAYAARAYSSVNPLTDTATTITVWHQLPLNTIDFDQSNSYNTSTYQYSAPVAGIYMAVAQARWQTTLTGYTYQVGIAKNNGVECYDGGSTSGMARTLNASCIMQMAAGDNAELMVWYNNTSTMTFDAGRTDTFFSIERMDK